LGSYHDSLLSLRSFKEHQGRSEADCRMGTREQEGIQTISSTQGSHREAERTHAWIRESLHGLPLL